MSRYLELVIYIYIHSLFYSIQRKQKYEILNIILGFPQGYNANHALYLAVNWTTLFVVKHVILLFQDLIIPYFHHKKRVAKKKVGLDGVPLTVPEDDFTLQEYIDAESRYYPTHLLLASKTNIVIYVVYYKFSMNTYGEASIFFASYALFGAALPMGSFLLFLQNWMKVKNDIWLHMLLWQRPHPIMSSSVGAWKDVLDVIAVLAVISNAAMVSFTLNTFQARGYSKVEYFWFFIMIQYVTFSLHYVRKTLISRDKSIEIQLLRSDFIESKLIDRIPDLVIFVLFL